MNTVETRGATKPLTPVEEKAVELSNRLVIIESPYSGDVSKNERYARACLADSLARGEAPFASHLLYTQPGVLDDTKPEQRALGIASGFAWRFAADYTVVYVDLGITPGMQAGIDLALRIAQHIEFRRLGGEWTP